MKSDTINMIRIYNLFKNWTDINKKAIRRMEIAQMKGIDRYELIKLYIKNDFFLTFINICRLFTENYLVESNQVRFVQEIVGSIIGRIVFETTELSELHSILNSLEIEDHDGLMKWVMNRNDGYVWISNTFLDHIIQEIFSMDLNAIADLEIETLATLADYAKIEFASLSGVSYTDIESVAARGVSQTILKNILYGFIVVERLIEGLGDKLFLTWLAERDLFAGYSGKIYSFDGIISLDEDEMDSPWLLKCTSTYRNPLIAIESIKSELDDLGRDKCILFLPILPSTFKYGTRINIENRHEIIILDLTDFYTLIRIDSSEIIGFLRRKML